MPVLNLAARLELPPGSELDALQQAIDTSPSALSVSDPRSPDCPLVLVNDAFLRLTRYERHEVIGRNCRFLQGERSHPAARAKLKAAVESGTEAAVTIVNYRKDGSAFLNAVQLAPIFDRQGRLIFILGSQAELQAPEDDVPMTTDWTFGSH